MGINGTAKSDVDIERYFAARKPLIDEQIDKFLGDNLEATILGISTYMVRGGKRLRPLLVLLTNEALGGDLSQAVPSAVAIELVHASSLAVDDIIDLDTQRRGMPSTWVAHGVSKTVLVSNLLIPYAQMLVEPLGRTAVVEVIDTWLKITRGEILEVFHEQALYEDIVKLKTSSLFQLSLVLGALSAGRGELLPVLKDYGRYLGMAYQVSDDIADFLNRDKKGVREVEALKRFVRWLGFDPESRTPFKVTEVVEEAVRRLRDLLSKAEEKALSIHEPGLSTWLHALPRYMARRMLREAEAQLEVMAISI